MTEPAEQPFVEGSLLGRATRIARVMAKVGLSDFFSKPKPDDGLSQRERARRFREAFQELGPTFCKLGQILSTRPDLLPKPFIDELSTLQDRVPPMTEAEVVRVMEEEMGVPWEDAFATIEEHAMAAGSMAEVHRATLESGERVVVKVQRPTARKDILQDLELLKLFAERTAERSAFRQVVDAPAIIEHLSDSLRKELDCRIEAENIERMREVLAPYERLEVPALHERFTTERMLVMEEVRGVPIRRAPPSAARREAARQLLESYYRQILTDGFFHADPHPGNLMWSRDRIYFLDFGMVGEVPAEVREMLLLLLMAMWQEDVSFLSDVILMLSGASGSAELDPAEFERDLEGILSRHRHLSLKEIQLGPVLQEITEVSIKHDVRLPASLALTGKALAQMQLVAAELDAELDPFQVAGKYVTGKLTDQLRSRMNPRRLFYDAQKLSVRLRRLAEAIERLAGARPGPRLQVHFRGTERLEDTIRRAGRRLSLALSAGGALVAAAIAASSERVAGWVGWTLGGVGVGLTLFLLADLLRRRR